VEPLSGTDGPGGGTRRRPGAPRGPGPLSTPPGDLIRTRFTGRKPAVAAVVLATAAAAAAIAVVNDHSGRSQANTCEPQRDSRTRGRCPLQGTRPARDLRLIAAPIRLMPSQGLDSEPFRATGCSFQSR
jgi:hypothetical protein